MIIIPVCKEYNSFAQRKSFRGHLDQAQSTFFKVQLTSIAGHKTLANAAAVALQVFKIKDPTTTIVSTTVEGISPEVQAVPQPKLELNITLNLHIVVHNPNQASFTHGTGGAALVYYQGTQVGVAVIPPGTIPANGNGTIYSEVTLEAELFMSKIGELLKDVLAGEIEIDTKSTVPGRVKILGIFQKHVVSVSDCQILIGIPDLKVRQQVCNYGIKF
ncbi:hypothetical protein NE237_007517 [Protea cynaroides]|uniref:Late embryogenesis abundant protein LEA-2 subgroup domain-containing protein n=1 Tax=Protea cynaroides TaxID=273540 RepID=A0A9Q0KPA5_9MAGN|nr:hypothetical protein NE237_007517 [Protea cynaroides]